MTPSSPTLFSRVVPATLAMTAALGTAGFSFAAEDDHHLFVGVNLFLADDEKPSEVVRFDGEQVVMIDAEGNIDTIKKSNGFNFQRSPKVSSAIVTIDSLESEAVFSPQNDPQRAWLKTRANLTGSLVDQATTAQANQAAAAQQSFFAQGAAGNAFNTEPVASPDSISMGAAGGLDSALYQLDTTFDSTPLQQKAYAMERSGAFDAVELRFMVSSPLPIANAQVVALVGIQLDDERREVTFHRKVGRIGPEPRKITLMQANLPTGFEIIDQEIHVFSGREEIATTLSPKRTELNREFASKFAQLDYIGNQTESTAKAAPIWSLAPAELRGATNVKEIDYPVTVDLDAEGNVVAIQGSASPSHVESIVSKMAFLPALESGKPVASRLEVNPADYFR